MSDFHQPSALVTLHLLVERGEEQLEAKLVEFTKQRPLALLLPCHVSEIGSPGFTMILRTLPEVRYTAAVFIGLDGADNREFERAREVFSGLPMPTYVIWNDAPDLASILSTFPIPNELLIQAGKGRNLWLLAGCALAHGGSKAFVAHDCDILTYSRAFLARLCFPIAHPEAGFAFAKGYGARFTDRMHGRVMRLMLTPLLRALRPLLPGNRLLEFLDSFRYPLSGEFAIDAQTAELVGFACDWGVDLGILASVFSLVRPDSICQVECCPRFDHKHRALCCEGKESGLKTMAADVARRLFLLLHKGDMPMDQGLLAQALENYRVECTRVARAYQIDAEINGLLYDEQDESQSVAVFEQSLENVVKELLQKSGNDVLLPSWKFLKSERPAGIRELAAFVRKAQL